MKTETALLLAAIAALVLVRSTAPAPPKVTVIPPEEPSRLRLQWR
jgi:hypothetical protein